MLSTASSRSICRLVEPLDILNRLSPVLSPIYECVTVLLPVVVRNKCLADVRAADLFLLLVGWRYGYIPEGATHSMIELDAFRRLLASRHVVSFFSTPEDVATRLAEALALFQRRAGHAVANPSPRRFDHHERATELALWNVTCDDVVLGHRRTDRIFVSGRQFVSGNEG
jgi:hypothetical protein